MTELVAARTIDELRELAPTGDLLAGGTDLLVQIQEGRKVARLIDLSRLSTGHRSCAESVTQCTSRHWLP
jgi:CO/xanthine dehydrogenase FAD-binding subunit